MIALLSVIFGLALSRSPISFVRGLIVGIAVGLALVTVQYAWFQSSEEVPRRILSFVVRITDWFGVAFAGAASTDNLLFAYTMGLIAWMIGFVGAWFAFRKLTPWWVIIPSGAALLLNLSYASQDLLWLVMVQLVASFLLLISLNSLRTMARWRTEDVDHGFMQGTRFAATGTFLAALIILLAWRMPVGEVSRGVAAGWEHVAGPWQSVQVELRSALRVAEPIAPLRERPHRRPNDGAPRLIRSRRGPGDAHLRPRAGVLACSHPRSIHGHGSSRTPTSRASASTAASLSRGTCRPTRAESSSSTA